jgi:hypothetical protein
LVHLLCARRGNILSKTNHPEFIFLSLNPYYQSADEEVNELIIRHIGRGFSEDSRLLYTLTTAHRRRRSHNKAVIISNLLQHLQRVSTSHSFQIILNQYPQFIVRESPIRYFLKICLSVLPNRKLELVIDPPPHPGLMDLMVSTYSSRCNPECERASRRHH